MTHISTKMPALMTVLLLLCSSCTAITHVDEFEVEDISPEIKTCMDQEFNLNLSEECTYCRCTNCAVEIRDCGLKCWEIVTCAIVNRCDRGNTSSCVADNCANLLNRTQAGVDQASALAVCIGSCSEVCFTE